jgi:hypothetical protein
MTGQVKEEILTRWGELGILVDGGRIRFSPYLLRDEEWLTEEVDFTYVDTGGIERSLRLEAGSLAFTFCQVPIVYIRGDIPRVAVETTDGKELQVDGDTLDEAISAEIFARTGRMKKITVYVPA